jgi:isoleucyl-tRNA synthetase
MFKSVHNKVDFAAQEHDVLAFWREEKIFEQSLDQRRDAKEFVFYDGPPFATGLPHYGHLLAGTIKDIIPRYQTMRGHYVERRFGWDCHGLPVEFAMEQELNISGKRDIETLGIDVFNEKCRGIVLRYTEEWREIVTRMGRWVDFDHDYKTMDTPYMESIWWVFKSLWDKSLIYEGKKILPYCPRCTTPLSNFETNQGYMEVKDPAITVMFPLVDQPDTAILAWTTTPWTLPSNLALAVGGDITYVKVRDGERLYILARDRLAAYYKNPDEYELIEELEGRALAGLAYTPLFPYFAAHKDQGAFRVCLADFVSTEDGTGVVHIAPGFGEDDSQLGHREGLPVVCPVDDEGRFTADVPDYEGRAVKEADTDIIRRLKAEGRLVHQGTILHSYPHCWRCDEPLIYRAVSTWFVRVEQMREQLMENNRPIHWVPGHIRDGRFGRWLESARDWALSRNRYWGTPLPVWQSEDGSESVCVGSVAELEEYSGVKVTDLHKHFVDAIEIPSPTGGAPLRRVPQVLDCWFESGAMPYAQIHYPFENKEWFHEHFPADFIAEGLDQTRGWFYTLTVLSTALHGCAAFKNVVVNGMVLAADGRKMSKRLKNYPDPMDIVNTYGADALRLYMISSPVVRAEDLCFTEDGVKHALRHLLIPWWNAYSFFVTYANIDGWTPTADAAPQRPAHLLDRWILSAMERLAHEVVAAMDVYDLQLAVRPFIRFVEDLTNWYIRRSRRRFWKSTDDADKQEAYATLYAVLVRLSRIAAPFVPFISETIYRNLRTESMPASVHLCDFPVAEESRRDRELEKQMETVMTVIGLGRQLRSSFNVKVRQPLATLHLVCRNDSHLEQVGAYAEMIRDELNVHEIRFSQDESAMADFHAKPNFSRLGPRLGARVKQAVGWIKSMRTEQLLELLEGRSVCLTLADGERLELEPEDVVVDRQPKAGLAVAAEGSIVVALDLQLTPALLAEGLAREFVNKVQQMRKTADLEVTQRIAVCFAADAAVQRDLMTHESYIGTEVLATSLTADLAAGEGAEWDLNGAPVRIAIRPV